MYDDFYYPTPIFLRFLDQNFNFESQINLEFRDFLFRPLTVYSEIYYLSFVFQEHPYKLAVLPDGGVMVAEEFSQSVWIYHSPGVEMDLSSQGIVVQGIATDRFFSQNENPTAIRLSKFKADKLLTKNIIEWQTETETDNAGFNIWRAEAEIGAYEKINASLISASDSAIEGANYKYMDPDVKFLKSYWYKLEDIDLNGTSTFHGPVSATPRWLLGIFSIFRK